MSVLPPGSKLGRFQLSTVLGQGAMGVVYLANDPEIGRAVAIKTVRPEVGRGENAAQIEARFLKEARLAGRLQHPNIVTVYDVGRDGDSYFIAMEYVDGRPLTDYLGASGELPLTAKIGIICQVAEALAHAHERGVLHRDIKPGNILIARDGQVKVTDFGIGKFTTAATSEMTRTGLIVGSPAYMSPEQVRGDKLDGRSDLFALGVVLYELLTGTRPFPGDSITTLVYQILHTEPRDPLELKADLPIATREVMVRLLAKQPEKRPADAKEFIRELKRIEKIQRESEVTRRMTVMAPVPESAALPASPPAPPPAQPAVTKPVTPSVPPPATVAWPAERRRSALPVWIVAAAALLLVGILILREWQQRPAPVPSAVPLPPVAAPTAAPPLPTEAQVAEAPSPAEVAAAEAVTPEVPILPTPGAHEAVDTTVGAPRVGARDRPKPTARHAAPPPIAASPREEPAAGAHETAPPAAAPGSDRVDTAYSTRRSVRFTSSPDQARLIIDGRMVGTADDWDNRGGGRAFEFEKPGSHDVLLELPGYRTLHLRIDVSPDADKDSISIDEELDRRQRVSYDKLPAVYDRTTGAVAFTVEPPEVSISEGGKTLGSASAFGPGSPLQLRGPMVHDLVLSAPGHKPKLVRILVAGNAGRDLATVKETLKGE